jgi:hypothetical protein
MSDQAGGLSVIGGLDLAEPFFLLCILAIFNPNPNSH